MGYNISGAAMRTIEAILKAARKPCPEIVKSTSTGGYVFVDAAGVRHASRYFATEDAARAAWEAKEDEAIKDFAAKLVTMEPAALQRQAECWVYDTFVKPLGDSELDAYASGAAQSSDAEWNAQIQAAAKREQQRRNEVVARRGSRRGRRK